MHSIFVRMQYRASRYKVKMGCCIYYAAINNDKFSTCRKQRDREREKNRPSLFFSFLLRFFCFDVIPFGFVAFRMLLNRSRSHITTIFSDFWIFHRWLFFFLVSFIRFEFIFHSFSVYGFPLSLIDAMHRAGGEIDKKSERTTNGGKEQGE